MKVLRRITMWQPFQMEVNSKGVKKRTLFMDLQGFKMVVNIMESTMMI
jgi:hypothetical protein